MLKKKKQLVQDLIPPLNIYIHMCTLIQLLINGFPDFCFTSRQKFLSNFSCWDFGRVQDLRGMKVVQFDLTSQLDKL